MSVRTLSCIVEQEFDGCRVDTALRQKLSISGSLLKDLKKYEDGILLDGKHIRTIDTVSAKQILTVNIHDTISENIEAQDIPFHIMYEDEDILIVNKPPHMPVHPSMGHFNGTLANAVMYHYAKNGEQHMFRAVNRLDGDTSGVMCIAKNAYSHALLGETLHTDGFERRYTAIAEGIPAKDRDWHKIDAPIARADFMRREVRADGQRAVTHYRVADTFDKWSIVELRLETGRTHQIRVHMSYIGHPLLGDWLYGTENKELFPRHALHSSYLKLIHPVSGAVMEFSAPLAKDMEEFCYLNKNKF